MNDRPLSGRTALVTGANHGIGAATAIALARLGADVAVTFLRLDADDGDDDDPGRPAEYARQRRQDSSVVVSDIDPSVRSVAIEADLSDPATPARLFDQVEVALGPVDILVNNASGWRKDTPPTTPPPPFEAASPLSSGPSTTTGSAAPTSG